MRTGTEKQCKQERSLWPEVRHMSWTSVVALYRYYSYTGLLSILNCYIVCNTHFLNCPAIKNCSVFKDLSSIDLPVLFFTQLWWKIMRFPPCIGWFLTVLHYLVLDAAAHTLSLPKQDLGSLEGIQVFWIWQPAKGTQVQQGISWEGEVQISGFCNQPQAQRIMLPWNKPFSVTVSMLKIFVQLHIFLVFLWKHWNTSVYI